MYVLDSSALIEVIEQRPRFDKIVKLIGDASFNTTSICAHEILIGARTERERFVLDGILSKMQVLPHDHQAALIGSRIELELERTGNKIGPRDVLIAAVCKSNNAELVTCDTDFARVKDIKMHILS